MFLIDSHSLYGGTSTAILYHEIMKMSSSHSVASCIQTLYYFMDQNDTWHIKLPVRMSTLILCLLWVPNFQLCLGHCCHHPRHPPSSFDHLWGYIHLFTNHNIHKQYWHGSCSLYTHYYGLGKSSSISGTSPVRVLQYLHGNSNISFHFLPM